MKIKNYQVNNKYCINTTNTGENSFNLFTVGVYILQMLKKDGSIETRKIIKQ